MKKIIVFFSLLMMISLSSSAYVSILEYEIESEWNTPEATSSGYAQATPDGEVRFTLEAENSGPGAYSSAQITLDYGCIFLVEQSGDGKEVLSNYLMDNDDSVIAFRLYFNRNVFGIFSSCRASISVWLD